MIIVCDECETRYQVPDQKIGASGRRVRCMNCSHEWHQERDGSKTDVEPDDSDEDPKSFDEYMEEAEPAEPEDMEPIPESVKPVPEGSELPALHERKGNEPEREKGVYAGYAAAAAIFGLIVGGFLLAHKPMVKLWPATMALYNKTGIKSKIEGENLIFDRLHAVAKGKEGESHILHIEGQILNLSREEEQVPNIQTSLIMEGGEAVDSWVVEPESKVLEREGEIAFETSYPDIPADVKEVNVKFIPGDEIRTQKLEGYGGGSNGDNGEYAVDKDGPDKSDEPVAKGTFLGGGKR